MTGAKPLHFGLNLNNREALIAPGYGVPELLDMAVVAEEAGFKLGLGRRQPVLEAALRAARAVGRGVATDQESAARYGVPRHRDP